VVAAQAISERRQLIEQPKMPAEYQRRKALGVAAKANRGWRRAAHRAKEGIRRLFCGVSWHGEACHIS
jgi:hypothetical protein